ncbi:unnamed protein product [Closterium sp. NIES-65]|nr:unnamed protein product [Closterium sp. NIES-65]
MGAVESILVVSDSDEEGDEGQQGNQQRRRERQRRKAQGEDAGSAEFTSQERQAEQQRRKNHAEGAGDGKRGGPPGGSNLARSYSVDSVDSLDRDESICSPRSVDSLDLASPRSVDPAEPYDSANLPVSAHPGTLSAHPGTRKSKAHHRRRGSRGSSRLSKSDSATYADGRVAPDADVAAVTSGNGHVTAASLAPAHAKSAGELSLGEDGALRERRSMVGGLGMGGLGEVGGGMERERGMLAGGGAALPPVKLPGPGGGRVGIEGKSGVGGGIEVGGSLGAGMGAHWVVLGSREITEAASVAPFQTSGAALAAAEAASNAAAAEAAASLQPGSPVRLQRVLAAVSRALDRASEEAKAEREGGAEGGVSVEPTDKSPRVLVPASHASNSESEAAAERGGFAEGETAAGKTTEEAVAGKEVAAEGAAVAEAAGVATGVATGVAIGVATGVATGVAAQVATAVIAEGPGGTMGLDEAGEEENGGEGDGTALGGERAHAETAFERPQRDDGTHTEAGVGEEVALAVQGGGLAGNTGQAGEWGEGGDGSDGSAVGGRDAHGERCGGGQLALGVQDGGLGGNAGEAGGRGVVEGDAGEGGEESEAGEGDEGGGDELSEGHELVFEAPQKGHGVVGIEGCADFSGEGFKGSGVAVGVGESGWESDSEFGTPELLSPTGRGSAERDNAANSSCISVEFHIIRHGQSTQSPALIAGRSPAARLTPTGCQQAVSLGTFLRRYLGLQWDEVFCSPIPRATHTARLVCQELGFPTDRIQEAPDLQEMSAGHWEGKSRAELFSSDAALAWMTASQPDFCYPGGESQREVEYRMGPIAP